MLCVFVFRVWCCCVCVRVVGFVCLSFLFDLSGVVCVFLLLAYVVAYCGCFVLLLMLAVDVCCFIGCACMFVLLLSLFAFCV